MKYLKTYNESSSSYKEELENSIKDILLDLSDLGYECNFYFKYFNNIKVSRIDIHVKNTKFNKEIKSVIDRLTSYLNTEGFRMTNTGFFGSGSSLKIEYTIKDIFEGMENEIPDSPERQDMINTINDICLDLQDEGFIVDNYGSKSDIYDRYESQIEIIVHRENNSYFYYTEILEVFDRLIKYMRINKYEPRVFYYENGWYDLDNNILSNWFRISFTPNPTPGFQVRKYYNKP